MKYKKTGRCLCGDCKFSFESNILTVGVCHCNMCRRWSGGVIMGLHIDSPMIFENEKSLKWYKSSDWGMRGFCKNCGTNLCWSTVNKSMMVPFAGSLDDVSDLEFTSEIFIDEKPDFYAFKNNTKKQTGEEVFAQFGN